MGLLDSFLEYVFMPMYGLTLLVALWKYPKYFGSPLKFFPVLLMYTLLSEVLGYLVRNYDQFSLSLDQLFLNYTWVVFNIYNLVFFIFFFYVFGCYLKKKWQKGYLVVGVILLSLSSIFNAYESNFLLQSQVYAYVTGGLILLGAIVLYFQQQYRASGRWFDSKDLLSWLSAGMLVFYSGYIPIKLFRHYFVIYPSTDPMSVRRLHLSLIVLMYACFITGFLKMRPEPR